MSKEHTDLEPVLLALEAELSTSNERVAHLEKTVAKLEESLMDTQTSLGYLSTLIQDKTSG